MRILIVLAVFVTLVFGFVWAQSVVEGDIHHFPQSPGICISFDEDGTGGDTDAFVDADCDNVFDAGTDQYLREIDWTRLRNYPTGCSGGEFVTTIGDTLTCAAAGGGLPGYCVAGDVVYTASDGTPECDAGGVPFNYNQTTGVLSLDDVSATSSLFSQSALTADGTVSFTSLGNCNANTQKINATAGVLACGTNTHTTDTGPSPDCSGATTYQNGEGNCIDIDPVYENELNNSLGLRNALSDETGTGLAVFGTSPTIATPFITGKVDRNNVAVSDDSCVFDQGLWWYDTTDSQFEFCDANSGTPATLTHTVDTGPSPDCSGTSTYQDGEGGCDTVGGDISGGLDAVVVANDSHNHTGSTLTAAGADTQIQYNTSNAFGAEAGFTYNASTNVFTCPEAIFTDYYGGTVTDNITASTTQSQGQGDIDCQICDVDTVTNDDDVVTIDTDKKGVFFFVHNNDVTGTNRLQVYPGSGSTFAPLTPNKAVRVEFGQYLMCGTMLDTGGGFCTIMPNNLVSFQDGTQWPTAYTQTYSATDKTHSNFVSSDLTDSTGGSQDNTVVAVSGTGDDADINNNFSEVATEINLLRDDIEDIKRLVNSIIDDLETTGQVLK